MEYLKHIKIGEKNKNIEILKDLGGTATISGNTIILMLPFESRENAEGTFKKLSEF